MIKHRRHRTHLPERFLLKEPEDNLVAAIIKQAWCDAFAGEVKDIYAEYHREDDKKNARQMFEAELPDVWRRSLKNLADAIEIDDRDLVIGYARYRKKLEAGTVKMKASDAFDLLFKTLSNGGRFKK